MLLMPSIYSSINNLIGLAYTRLKFFLEPRKRGRTQDTMC